MQNEDTVKAAARTMCAHFLSKNVKVTHTLMLEAIAAGFGLDCWRELKAVIDAPRAVPKTVFEEGQSRQWTIDAIYLDNNQQYGDTLFARTALEAAIRVQVERLTDFCQVGILNVADQNGENRLSPDFHDELAITTPRVALEKLRTAVSTWGGNGLTPKEQLAFDWLNELLYETDKLEAGRTKDSYAFLAENPNFLQVKTRKDLTEASASKALEILCTAVERNPIFKGNVLNMERGNEELARAIYHIRALTEYFADAVNENLYAPDLDSTLAVD